MSKTKSLMVRIDPSSKRMIARAASLRGVSASDYVRLVVVAQARRELDEEKTKTIAMTPEEQLAFWEALHEPVKLTRRQRDLGRIMRGQR